MPESSLVLQLLWQSALVPAIVALALLAIAAVVLVWGLTVTWGFGHPGPKAARLPLGVFVVSLVGAIAVSGLAPEAAGPLARWLESLAIADLGSVSADRFLLLLGVFAIQLSTGNVLVRLVLKATGTINPRADGGMPPTQLKGVTQSPIQGVSFAHAFDDAKAPTRHHTQYFEMFEIGRAHV